MCLKKLLKRWKKPPVKVETDSEPEPPVIEAGKIVLEPIAEMQEPVKAEDTE